MPMLQEVTRSCGKPVEPYTFTFTTDNFDVDDDGNRVRATVIFDMRPACHLDSPLIASVGAVIPTTPQGGTFPSEKADLSHTAVPSGGIVGLCPHEYNLLTTGRINPMSDDRVSPRWHFSLSPAPQV